MTDPITPQEAQQLLDGTTPSPWLFSDGWSISPFTVDEYMMEDDPWSRANARLAAAAPTLAKALAADIVEYAIEECSQGVWYLTEYDEDEQHIWSEHRDIVEEGLATLRKNWPGNQHRLVARRVSPTWEVKEGA